MLWLKSLFIVLISISQMYVISFQSSDEGRDERGKEIQYKTNNVLFNVLYLGIIGLITFHLVDIISAELLPNILLYFMLSLSVLGSVFIFINRHRKNY
ncbi:hypothetical protein CN567_29585 [Bacillus toyonensis]|uniref:hypothetical protein n=1 Tax=Bacillus toyonensis TaxID=155322 RepID=UPI000BF217FF|nr:hypothetical protein [Bacillus toyonensis]PEO56012.1 hypothetical protein CN567_29585 [Bacillus toyonensis]PFX72513.1 hypothetical protein COL37_28895 [Bacillus toyonensis]PFX73353.1 hypothetical protein COL38_31245 [Bacillus toyonensis]PGB06687.1 hypothetical protein COL98_26460 [Bacillus toyonensis]